MNKSFLSLNAADVMSRSLVFIPREMSVQGAARLLSDAHVSGAPVVDGDGRCVGVLSTTDFLHWVENGKWKNESRETSECVCNSWQIFGEALPTDTVDRFMTHDPVVVTANKEIGELAQMMLDAHIHRLIVVDQNERPIGIVSSTDVLAAVAHEARIREGMNEILA